MGMLWFIEEANLVFAKNSEGRFDLGDGPVLGLLRTARKITVTGETSVFLIDQIPSKLHAASLANCRNFLIFRLTQSQDVREAGNGAGLKPEQRNELCELLEREMVGRLDKCKRPIKIQIDELKFPKPLSKEEARRRSAPILQRIPFVEKVEQKEPEQPAHPDGLDPESDEYRTFAFVVRKPYAIAEDGIRETGLGGDKYRRNIKKLNARGLVSSGLKAGSKYVLTGPTSRGLQLAKRLGLPVCEGNEGVVHRSIRHYAGESLRAFCEDISFPRPVPTPALAGRVVDDVAVHPTGRRIVLQYCSKNSPSYEAEALLDLHCLTLLEPEHVDAIESAVAVAVNKSHARSITKEVKQRSGGQVPAGIALLDFDTVVKGEVDWPELFGLENG